MRVAFSSISSFAEQKLLPRLGKINNWLLLDFIALILSSSVDDRSNWHFNNRRSRAPTVLILALAMSATFGSDQGFKEQGNQAGRIVISHKNDIPTPAAISSIWAAMGDEFFPAKTATPIASIPSFGVDADLIDELHWRKVPPPST